MTPPSYLYLNGCTNYGANIAVTVESSSLLVGGDRQGRRDRRAGRVGGRNLVGRHKLAPYPGADGAPPARPWRCRRRGSQLVTMTADDDRLPDRGAADWRARTTTRSMSPAGPTTRYPTQPGYDMYTGYGRINAGKIVAAVAARRIPPEAQIDGPDWFGTFSPSQTLDVRGLTAAVRARSYRWQLEVGAGTSPEPGAWYLLAHGHGTRPTNGLLASVPLSEVASVFPAGTSFAGGPVGASGAPDPDRFSFTLRLVVTDDRGLIGMDRRTDFLHHDPTLLPGFPKQLGGSVDGGARARADRAARAVRAAGRDRRRRRPRLPAERHGAARLAGPHGRRPVHLGERAYTSRGGQLDPAARRSSAASPSATSARRPAAATTSWRPTSPAASTRGRARASCCAASRSGPCTAFSSPAGARRPVNRLQRGIVGAPALADLQGNGKLDIVVSSMDRHVYAWQPNGRPVPGWPVLVVDRSEVQSVDPVNDKVTFKPGIRSRPGDTADRHARGRRAQRRWAAGRRRRRRRGVQRRARMCRPRISIAS